MPKSFEVNLASRGEGIEPLARNPLTTARGIGNLYSTGREKVFAAMAFPSIERK